MRAELRETVTFAVHDLLKDSPFSRLELVSCRNLLIYLNDEAQKRALDIFHFALRPEGRLFLGASESVSDSSNLFNAIDKRHRIYSSRFTGRTHFPVPPRPSALAETETLTSHRTRGPYASPAGAAFSGTRLDTALAALGVRASRSSWSEWHLKLAEQFGPPSMIVNAEHEILHLSQSASPFLAFAAGEPSANLIRAAHPALRVELHAALLRAQETGQVTTASGIAIDLDGRSQLADVRVAPASSRGNALFVVTLHLVTPARATPSGRWLESKMSQQ